MCRVKKLWYTKCNHISGVILAYEDEWCQYKQAYPATPFPDCPNSNKGDQVQTYPEWDWCAACKDRGMHRGEIEARAQAVRATVQTQGVQAVLPASPVYQQLQPNPYQAQDPYQAQGYQAPPYQQQQVQYEPDPNAQQQIQYAPDPNQQAQYQPDPYQQNPGYQADPGYYLSASGSPVQAASPYAPGSPVNQGYQQAPGYQADPNAAAGQQQGYPGGPGGPGSPESVGQVFDSVFTPPANRTIQTIPETILGKTHFSNNPKNIRGN